ncbi:MULTISPECIES: cytochrome c biogenesis protein ResB [Bacillus]|uniref:Cytochrome C biogenesis protein n=2 Tax=Bacillus TaxID=1386 RepID=A0A0M4G8E9_9BACI|nr:MULTISPECIES: cytochrome c biogenesis protein ResB [Bacillus]ALC81453.1 cytochrome C biogenesis protein [Bacillus gobiensis]MBP1080492.1 cytochrome c biogenesis protein [Bacillus capparidis]MED1094349.1 cytochrome c biogenesis protein ResB [Bacillus capparidis]
MNEVKCECGHVNPFGTVLCEACGKPLIDDGKKLLDMRYDGSARRSQVYKKTSIDKVWNFFSSVKVGVWLIVITLVASAIGSFLPQETFLPRNAQANTYYKEQYGLFGDIYYFLGFHNLYGSWWYLLLIASIGISLVICSLDRVIPLYRALKKQRTVRNENFMERQRIFSRTDKELSADLSQKLYQLMKKKRYRVREENGNLFAEKGRFSRWGPYVNHIGLIIFLVGAMLRFVPGIYVDEVLWIREGETLPIPGTDGEYYLKNNQFIRETYNSQNEKEIFSEAINAAGDGSVAKNFQTNVELFNREDTIVHGKTPELSKIKDEEIKVNEPLKFDSFALYQVDFKESELNQMAFQLIQKSNGKSFGRIKVDLVNPEANYDLGNGYKVKLSSYLPDFYFNSSGEPDTKSRVPNNPAFVFTMITPDHPDGEKSFVAIQETIEPSGENEFQMKFDGVETKNVSGLTVRKDLTLPVLAVGGIIFMIGVVQGMYWQHRRIWIRSSESGILLAGHTNKNWHGLQKEISQLIDGELAPPEDQSHLQKKAAKIV